MLKAKIAIKANKHKKSKSTGAHLSGNRELVAGAIVLFTLLLYLPSLTHGFVDWDDPDYLRDNLVIHRLGWEQLKTIFSSFYGGNYHPLTTLSYAFEYAVSGYKSATLYHFNNLLLHLINVILVYWFIRQISRQWIVAAIVALWFGIHPMHVESVAWVSERKDLLYSAFFLASLIGYGYYIRNKGSRIPYFVQNVSGNQKFYWISMLFFLLSALSKSAAVVLPVVLLLLDFLAGRKFSPGILLEKIPYLFIAVVFGILALLSQESAIHRGMNLDLSVINRFFTVNYAITRYLVMLFYPIGLSAYHPYPVMGTGWQQSLFYLSVIANIALIGTAVYLVRKSRIWLFGILFFLVNLILILQIIPVGGAFIAERYTYISYIGIFYLIASALVLSVEKYGKSGFLKLFMISIFLMLSGVFAITAHQRIGVWTDSMTLFNDVVDQYPENHMAYYLRAGVRKSDDAEGAIADYTKAINLKPENPNALNNRGNIHSGMGKYQEALLDYNSALKYDSTLTESLNNRGAIKAISGDLKGALADIEKALLLNPEYKDAYRNRGLVRLQMNDRTSARNDWKKAASLGDEMSKTLLNRYVE